MSGTPDYLLGETIDFKFTTRQFSNGVPTTLDSAGSPTEPAIEIYEDNSLTQITGAETLTVDFDGIAGFHNLRVVMTAANGFEAGKSYAAIIKAGTVGGTSVVGEVVQNFTIQRSPSTGVQILGPFPREYGVAATINFSLKKISGDLKTDAVHASGDVKIMKDEGAEVTFTPGFIDEGQGYSISPVIADMTAARIVLYIVDQSEPKAFVDTVIILETYGHTSSQYGLSADVLIATDMATRTSQTSFTLTDGPPDDDALKGHFMVITDQATNTQKSVVLILSYTGSTKSCTTTTPKFTTAAGDLIDVLAASPALPAALPASADGILTSDANNLGAGIVGTITNYDGLNNFDPVAQLTESYAANGVAPTSVQLWFAIHQFMMQHGLVGVNWTVRKLDNVATAFVVTLDDATNPTDAKRV